MTGIRTVDTLEVETDIGKCFIQLCVGDITALPKHEKVDVLVVSAFPGDYSPTPSSLIGQLLIKLGVSVSNLAKDKEEDLRQLYSCWWSKPLPDHLSFKKVLCFEGGGKYGRKVGQVVGDVFRCLVPILANSEGKVIMPILASGDQRKSKTRMLRLLVNAAIHWMQTGLPLRSLKIVIFSRDIKNISKADQPLFELFQDLKANHEQEENQGKEVKVESYAYDIYLSYSEEDKQYVNQVIDVLVKNKTDIQIFSSIQELDVEISWQAQLYDVIKKCKRVMALITPSFLQSARCTEQYNIALCHSRKTKDSILMPLYVFEVAYMPTYMRITQYIDCRICFKQKLDAACTTVIGSLSCKSLEVATKDGKDTPATTKPSNQTYDIFLSYSHCNSEYAMQIMKELRIKSPHLNVFIDTAELKAGGAWQLTLYSALECSKFVIALISNDYVHSKVCNEEFCLSIALQLQNNCKIWPIVIEPLEDNMDWLNMLSPVKCYKDSGEKNISMSFVCNELLAALEDYPGHASLPESMIEIALPTCLEEARSLFFKKEFVSLVVETLTDASLPDEVSTFLPKDTSCDVDIYIICSPEDSESCSLLQSIITSRNDSLVVKISTNENASTCLTYLDKCRLVIPLLSSSFMMSSDLVHELNIAWCRQRDCSSLCFLAVVLEQLPKNPTYVSLFPCFFNCEDNLWTKHPETLKLFSPDELTRVYQVCDCPLNILLCFMTAVYYIQKWHDGEQCPLLGVHNKIFNCLQLNKCIQRYKETMAKNDKEEEESIAAVVSSADSKEVKAEVREAACDEMISTDNDDCLKPTEHDHVGQNEAQSQDVVPPQQTSKENLIVEDKASQQGGTNDVSYAGSQNIDLQTTSDEAQKVEEMTRRRYEREKAEVRNTGSSTCKII